MTAEHPRALCPPHGSASCLITHLTGSARRLLHVGCVCQWRNQRVEPGRVLGGRDPRDRRAGTATEWQLLLQTTDCPASQVRGSLVGFSVYPPSPQPNRRPPLPSAVSHSQVGSDTAVREDLWELLEDADGEWLVLRPEVPTSSALKCC